MTEILKGDRDAAAMAKKGGTAQEAAVIPAPAIKRRLETPFMFLLFPDDYTNFIMLDAGHPIQAVTGQ
jgi:hypothetical protein